MKIDGSQAWLESNQRPRRVEPAKVPPSRDTDPAKSSASPDGQDVEPSRADQRGDEMDIHNNDHLRESAARLVASGDVKPSEDGSVRQARIDEVRKNYEAGKYNREDIIAGIVDRLLDQWKI